MQHKKWVHKMDDTPCDSATRVAQGEPVYICTDHDRRVVEVEVPFEEGVFEPIVTAEGATFEMYTNGWAVGYKVTAPGKPTRYVLLNASGAQSSEDLDDTDVFLYVTDDPTPGTLDSAVCFVEVWDGDEPEEHKGLWRVTYEIRSLIDPDDPFPSGVAIIAAPDAKEASRLTVEWVELNDPHYDDRIDPVCEIRSVKPAKED